MGDLVEREHERVTTCCRGWPSAGGLECRQRIDPIDDHQSAMAAAGSAVLACLG
jgi:hypothetical protein